MTDKPAESAVERYNALEWVPDGEMGFDPGGREVKAAADAAIAELKARIEELKVCGNCRHWWPGLLGCALDSSQEVVCEGRDRCKVFVQLTDRPETREPSWQGRES